jgi:hypothetical protein
MFNQLFTSNLYPWKGKQSLYEAIKGNLDDKGILQNDILPDDEEFWGGKPFRWVAGGLDGAFGHHASSEDNKLVVNTIVNLLVKNSRRPSNKLKRKIYLKLLTEDTLSVIDDILELLREQSGVNHSNLYEEAYWLASEGTHRNVVKFGIALLGLFQTDKHLELIMTLGKHEEFTLFSAVAIQNGIVNGNEQLFELAKFVDGWGKINLVERLSPDTQEIKNWLLREGYKNNIMYEYLAYICAINGELHKEIGSQDIDLALYEGAGDIISALIAGGPAEEIDDYEHASIVLGEFLRHSKCLCSTVLHLNVVLDIFNFLSDDEGWMKRYSKNWTNEEHQKQLSLCRKIINQDRWESIIWDGVKSEDSSLQWYCFKAAKILDIDLWDELFTQLQQDSVNRSLYFELMQTNEKSRIQKLVTFAENHLPLDKISTGPKEELGLGQEFDVHSCLDFVLQDLDKYEGVGAKLISTGLYSAVIRNRNMALKALEAWPVSSWNSELIKEVKELLEIEPDSSVKERIESLIKVKNL